MRYLVGIISALIMQSSIAGEIYTCKINGSVVYQGKPCAGSKALSDKVNHAKEKQQAVELARHRNEIESRQRSSRKEPRIGMSAVAAEKSSWGYPDDVNKTVNAYGVSEQWVYRGTGFAKNRYLYFKNGILTSMQE